MSEPDDNKFRWVEDCMRWRGKVLDGKYAHWCYDWDGLPVDETTDEFECCTCIKREEDAEYLAATGQAKALVSQLEREGRVWTHMEMYMMGLMQRLLNLLEQNSPQKSSDSEESS
jgi:hypothetical protein